MDETLTRSLSEASELINNSSEESKEGLSEQQMLTQMKENEAEAINLLSQLQIPENGDGLNIKAAKKASAAGKERLSGEIDKLVSLQKNKQNIEENAKGKQKDFTRAMSAAYGNSGAYRFDNIEVNQQVKPTKAPAISVNNTVMSSHQLTKVAQQSAKWLMLDSWYVIGPFENSERKHIHTSFPPENVIDFDAKYLGKKQQILTWKYQKFSRFPIVPVNMDEYEIYYAYTQVKSDRVQDVWLAVGSDDQSKIWLNNILIWNSLPQHKGWQINEGFRKVRLKAGVNEVLFRLENGQRSGGFSLAMAAGNS